MSNTLVDQYIDETFPGLLHSSGEELPITGKKDIYDGNGNKSALSLGRENNGCDVSGDASISGSLINKTVTYPTTSPNVNDLVAADKTNPANLIFIDLKTLLTNLGANISDGVYANPTLTFQNGILTGVTSSETPNTGGITSYTSSGVFSVPSGVSRLKFIITGGGGYSTDRSSGAGGTVIGFLRVQSGENIQVVVGNAGSATSNIGGETSITASDGLIAYAGGGNSTKVFSVNLDLGGGLGGIGPSSKLISYMIIQGGVGSHAAIATDDRDSVGGCSYWGSSPAWGGGAGGGPGVGPQLGGQFSPGGGIVVFEW